MKTDSINTTPKNVTEIAPADMPVDGLTYRDLRGDLRGYCYCCGRAGFKIQAGGVLSRHGFRRPRWGGYTTGACSGTARRPEETLALAIRATVADARRFAGELETDPRVTTVARLRLQARQTLVREKRSPFVGTYEAARKRLASFRRDAARTMRAVRALSADEVLSIVSEGDRAGGYRTDAEHAVTFTRSLLRMNHEAAREALVELVQVRLRTA